MKVSRSMGKSLVIVESPAKVKTLGKFLGSQYIVKSSVGHIRDLGKSTGSSKTQKKNKKKTVSTAKSKQTEAQKEQEKYQKLMEKMGIDPSNGWQAAYEILPGKEKVVKQLQEAAEKVDTIYLATDLDREGEAIAWHLMEAIGGAKSKYKRVTFAEITKKAIQEAFKSPSKLNENRVNAQQTRRFLDRLVGFMISPLLWRKVARGLSAGRVQSVALRMISERESSIHAFKPEEYWEVKAELETPKTGKIVLFPVTKKDGKAFRPISKGECDEDLKVLKKAAYKIKSVERKPGTSKPSAPYITSTLQQAGSLRLRYGVKKTMMVAQKLYEAGLITYMRTDSTNISEEALENCRDYITNKYGKSYLPDSANIYSSKKSAQEAHEAIRPTNLDVNERMVSSQLDQDAGKLYSLIWKQFVASQMNPALYDLTRVSAECGNYELRVRGRILTFDGFLKVQPPALKNKDNQDVILPPMSEGEILKLSSLDPSQHFTNPPPRFTEASLVRELEKKSIGRPSTYASIISTIQERGYVKVEQRRFFCLKMGEVVATRLLESFKNLMNYDFTANLEEKLDQIAEGGLVWTEVLDQFYKELIETLKEAEEGMRNSEPTEVPSISCPSCAKHMCLRVARTGVFLGCSGYSLPVSERCTETVNLIPGEEVESYSDDEDEGNVEELQSKKRCEKCDTAMDVYLIDASRQLHVCGKYPDCSGTVLEEGQFRIKGYDGPLIPCDKCDSDMQLKSGRFGKYFACTKKECLNTRKLLKNGEAAPPKSDPIHMPELKCEKSDGYFVLRDGAAGLFLASSAFPKSRETKKPQIADLLRHKDEIDPKFHNLLKAPKFDPDGNPAIVRFSRKTKEHYVGSMKDDKMTNWTLFWSGRHWTQEVVEK